MELLIIKSGETYLRFKGEDILEVGLDKASVYPMDQMARVRELEQAARAQGFEKIRVRKLMLKESDL